jgi:MADS-box transcription factor
MARSKNYFEMRFEESVTDVDPELLSMLNEFYNDDDDDDGNNTVTEQQRKQQKHEIDMKTMVEYNADGNISTYNQTSQYSPRRETAAKQVIKKHRGRKKIAIKYIKVRNRRNTTFTKRKNGLNKKFYELITLCGASGLLILISESGKAFTISSQNLKSLQLDRVLLQRVRTEILRKRFLARRNGRAGEQPSIESELPYLAQKPAQCKQSLLTRNPQNVKK